MSRLLGFGRVGVLLRGAISRRFFLVNILVHWFFEWPFAGLTFIALRSHIKIATVLIFLNRLQKPIQTFNHLWWNFWVFFGFHNSFSRLFLRILNRMHHILNLTLNIPYSNFGLIILVTDHLAFVFIQTLKSFSMILIVNDLCFQFLIFFYQNFIDVDSNSLFLGCVDLFWEFVLFVVVFALELITHFLQFL